LFPLSDPACRSGGREFLVFWGQKLRAISSRYLILNALLCFAAVWLGLENYRAWELSAGPRLNQRGLTRKAPAAQEDTQTAGRGGEAVPADSLLVISEKNIFSPERKDFPVAPPPAEISRPVVRPQGVLYGVAIAGDYESATVANPGKPIRKGERETLTIKVGDKIGDYKLAKILPDRIAMEANGDVFDVLLYDSRHPKKRLETRLEPRPIPAENAGPLPAANVSDEAKKISDPSADPGGRPVRPQRPLPFLSISTHTDLIHRLR
jgi:hypothetical protein